MALLGLPDPCHGIGEAMTTVSGRVATPDDEPLIGATVMIVGTSYGAMTNADGEFSIQVPQGTYDIEARMVGMSPEIIEDVTVGPDSVVDLEFILYWGPHFRPTVWDWPPPPEVSGAFLNIAIQGDPSDAEGLMLFIRQGSSTTPCILPRDSDSPYRIAAPIGDFELIWSLPGIPDQCEQVSLSSGRDTTIMIPAESYLDLADTLPFRDAPTGGPDCLRLCEATEQEWVAPGYALHRICIDPREFGDPSLEWAGFVGVDYFWVPPGGAEDWRVVLAYTDHLVSLSGNGESETIQFDTEVRSVLFSPNGRFVLALVPDMYGEPSGYALLVDVEEGISTQFPLIGMPGSEESPGHTRTTFIQVQGPEEKYQVYDDGSVIVTSDSTLTEYRLADNTPRGVACWTLNRPLLPLGRTPDGTLIAISKDESLPGTMLYISPDNDTLTSQTDHISWRHICSFDPSSGLLLSQSSSSMGLVLHDVWTGQELWRIWEGEDLGHAMLSQEGGAFCCMAASCGSFNQFGIVSYIESPEEPCTAFKGYTDNWRLRNNDAIGVDGDSMWRLSYTSGNPLSDWRDWRTRFILLSDTGETVWMSPVRFHAFSSFSFAEQWHQIQTIDFSMWRRSCSVSADGKGFIWSDNRLIHVCRLVAVE